MKQVEVEPEKEIGEKEKKISLGSNKNIYVEEIKAEELFQYLAIKELEQWTSTILQIFSLPNLLSSQEFMNFSNEVFESSTSYFQFAEPSEHPIYHQQSLLSSFNFEQIEFICETLYSWRDGERLVNLFNYFDSNLFTCLYSGNYCHSASITRAHLYALFHMGKYEELFKVMSTSHFNSNYHAELTELWYEARYAEDQIRKHKKLGPVDKYRIRKKYPPPSSIWDGDEVIYSFKECARRVLKTFYDRNKYPTSEEKREIARQTRLGIIQISNWFKNRRQRDKEK